MISVTFGDIYAGPLSVALGVSGGFGYPSRVVQAIAKDLRII